VPGSKSGACNGARPMRRRRGQWKMPQAGDRAQRWECVNGGGGGDGGANGGGDDRRGDRGGAVLIAAALSHVTCIYTALSSPGHLFGGVLQNSDGAHRRATTAMVWPVHDPRTGWAPPAPINGVARAIGHTPVTGLTVHGIGQPSFSNALTLLRASCCGLRITSQLGHLSRCLDQDFCGRDNAFPVAL